MKNKNIMKLFTRCSAVALLAASSQAAIVLSVTGPTTTAPTAGINKAFAVSFNLTSPLTGLSLLADISCISCSGTVYLMKTNLGPTSSAGDLIAAFAYSGSTTLFSGQNLSAGTYFAVLANTAGSTIWNATGSPVLSQNSGVSRGSDFTSTSFVTAFPPQSNFAAGLGDVFKYTLSDTPTPEPGTLTMMVAGLAVCLLKRKGR